MSTVLYAVGASIVALLLVVGLERIVGIAEAGVERYVLGGFCGALAVVWRHRRRPLLTIMVFVPTMAFFLFAITILFHVYVLGDPIEL